jgi:hypothetical protein
VRTHDQEELLVTVDLPVRRHALDEGGFGARDVASNSGGLLPDVFLQRRAAVHQLTVALISLECDELLVKLSASRETFFCEAFADLEGALGKHTKLNNLVADVTFVQGGKCDTWIAEGDHRQCTR